MINSSCFFSETSQEPMDNGRALLRNYNPSLMRNIYLSIVILLITSCRSENKSELELKFNSISPRGYSQSVSIVHHEATLLYISGQIPVNSDGEIVGLNDFEKQTEQVFVNIKRAIEEAGGSMNDLAKIDCYFTDLSKISEFRTARDKYINLVNPPASTVVQVERLLNEDFLIEISAVAVIKDDK